MDWGKLRFFFSEVFANFSRNAGMQVTAVGTVAVTILILGSFLYVRQVLGELGTTILKQIEISVYLNDNVDDAAAKKMQEQFKFDNRIATVAYVPKAEGFKIMRQRMAGQIDTSLVTTNPLPNAFRIHTHRPGDVAAVAAEIGKLPGVAKVNFAQEIVDRLLRLSDVVAKIGIGIIVLLVSTASIIIANTIRLTVFARRREIAIMQLVGATNAYIRGPFICEGLIAGVAGAVLAIGLLAIGRLELLPKLYLALPFVPLASVPIDVRTLLLELVGAGAAIGFVASWYSVGRYLRT